MTTRLLLIRHGVTLWNKQKRYCGHGNTGLSPEGKKQAALLGKKLKNTQIDKIYSSDRKRALQTARIAFKNSKITIMAELKEISFGALEGLNHDQAIKKYPVAYRKWLRNPFRYTMPGAEKMSLFAKRINRAIAKIAKRGQGKTTAIVCHGGSIAVFIAGLKKTKEFWRYVPGSTSLSIIEYKKSGPRIKFFNKTDHLK